MSTRSAIIIKVKKEDVGQMIKFDKDKLPTKLSDWSTCFGDGSDSEKSKKVKLSPYMGIYCHSDGYISGVGMVLKKTFDTYEKVINLVVGGDCSCIEDTRVRHYANRKGEEWKWLKPKNGKNPKEIADSIGHNGYVYLFDDGWKVSRDGVEFSDYDEDTTT